VSNYRLEMTHAPHRRAVNRPYLVDLHGGVPSTGEHTSRHEEHLALALFNDYHIPNAGLRMPDSVEVQLVTYQMPLQASRRDVGVGKVDLFGITAAGQATVIELKGAGGNDTPLRALLEGLAYAASCNRILRRCALR
jgi:hypothetical protein